MPRSTACLCDHGMHPQETWQWFFFLVFRCAEEKLLDPGQPRFDAAQAVGDGVVLLRHLPADGRMNGS